MQYAIREYAPELRIQYRTFIANLMSLPVTIETTASEARYRIDRNARDAPLMAVLETMCQRISARAIQRNGRRLVVELRDPPPPC